MLPPTLSFIPLTEVSAVQLSQVLSSKEMLLYMDLPRWEDAGEVASLIQTCRKGQASMHILLRNGVVVGIAGLSHICHKHRFAYITCGILPHFQGTGLAHEAILRVETLAFRLLELHRLEAQVHEHNTACIRLLHQLGYHEEGRMRGNFYVSNQYYDSILMSKLSDEVVLDEQ